MYVQIKFRKRFLQVHQVELSRSFWLCPHVITFTHCERYKTKLATETTTSSSSKDQVSGGDENPVGLCMKRCSESRKEAAQDNYPSWYMECAYYVRNREDRPDCSRDEAVQTCRNRSL